MGCKHFLRDTRIKIYYINAFKINKLVPYAANPTHAVFVPQSYTCSKINMTLTFQSNLNKLLTFQ